MKRLLVKGEKPLAMTYVSKVLSLIDESFELPVDNSIWPVKGYSFLYLSTFLSDASEHELCNVVIDKALNQTTFTNKKIKLEKYVEQYGEYKTHYNEENLNNFKSVCIYCLLKNNEIDKANKILLEINHKIESYLISSTDIDTVALFDEIGRQSNIYFRSVMMIGVHKSSKTGINYVLNNSLISNENKFNYFSTVLSNYSFEENILNHASLFYNKSMPLLFVDCMSSILRKTPSLINEYRFLSIFNNYLVNEKSFASQYSFSNYLLNLVYARISEYYMSITDKNDERFIILNPIIDNDLKIK